MSEPTISQIMKTILHPESIFTTLAAIAADKVLNLEDKYLLTHYYLSLSQQND